MQFEIIAPVTDVKTIAVGPRIRILRRLQRQFGRGRWRKMKGVTTVQLQDGSLLKAEIHWYEAHGIGRKLFKIKRPLS
jgi:hypothetical protein